MHPGSLIESDPLLPEHIAGVDEAGRGCLAGPVVAGAAVLPENYDLPYLTDSKKLTAAKREVLFDQVREQALFWAVGVAWPAEIDRVNILQATFRAMSRALKHLRTHPRLVRIDGNQTLPAHLMPYNTAQEAVIKGDGTVPAISAASILAKTFRDRVMIKLARQYPQYGFDAHMGYGTKAHCEAIQTHGPCRMHRMTFGKVAPEKPAAKQAGLPGL
jgi:ribonuclease HII